MLNFPLPSLSYLNILHAHSHFAFSGWIFMALALLITRELAQQGSLQFNWILLLVLISSFGMLISFSLQGYKAVSIIFSTLFLFLTYWFGFLAYRRWDVSIGGKISCILMRAGIWFLVISSLGPYALGILKASGNKGIIYQNSIYFYLHFQMNGWMFFCSLALIANIFLSTTGSDYKGVAPWLFVFIISTVPLFLIFTLWSKPPAWVFLVAFIAALMNAISWFAILLKLRNLGRGFPLLIKMALLAVSIKVLFQLLVCVPQIGEWTFSNRNLIIGYVHLITLGCVSPVIISQFTIGLNSRSVNYAHWFYISITIAYLFLLFIQPVLSSFGFIFPHYQYCLLAASLLFCLWGLIYYKTIFKTQSSISMLPLKNYRNQH